MQEKRVEEIEKLREVMGTLPHKNPQYKTNFHVGCEGIKVKMVAWPANPYRSIFEMVTATWGAMGEEPIDKWSRTSTEGRIMVVKAALSRQTLGHCLESPSFTFVIEGITRASFDQIARARIGAAFGARGSRDNNWMDADFRIPNALMKHPDLVERYKDLMLKSKELYRDIVKTGRGNWQTARAALSQYVCYKYTMTMTYAALQNFAYSRMKFCEMEDTVATAWLVWNEMFKKFPLLACYMRPGCDLSRQCQYHKAYSLSELFGCLFKPCGRNPSPKDYEYAEFNETCSDEDLLSRQIDIDIPKPGDWGKLIEIALETDIRYFKKERDLT